MMRNDPLQPAEQPIRLTKDEEQYLRSCLNNALWSIELPSVVSSGALMKLASNYGYIKQSKGTFFAVIFGTFIIARGFSYNNCFKKLLQQPGNTLAERINQRKIIVSRQTAEGALGGIQSGEAPGSDSIPWQQPSYLDMDSDKPDFPGIDPSLPQPDVDEQQPSKPAQNYADLRRQNRAVYQQPIRGGRPYGAPESPSSPPPRLPQDPALPTEESSSIEPSTAAAGPSRRRTRVNKYGDVWDE